MDPPFFPFVVVGGGIAGVSAVEQLLRQLPSLSLPVSAPTTPPILLISASSSLKGITNIIRITDNVESFNVVERPLSELAREHAGKLQVVLGVVSGVTPSHNRILLQDGREFRYGKLCVCSGGRPSLLCTHPLVLGIRDTETVQSLASQVSAARKVVVVGNGGIALEAVWGLRDCEVVWIMRHAYMGNTFFDASASRFFLDSRVIDTAVATILKPDAGAPGPLAAAPPPVHAPVAPVHKAPAEGGVPMGHALGPSWVEALHRPPPLQQRVRRRRRKRARRGTSAAVEADSADSAAGGGVPDVEAGAGASVGAGTDVGAAPEGGVGAETVFGAGDGAGAGAGAGVGAGVGAGAGAGAGASGIRGAEGGSASSSGTGEGGCRSCVPHAVGAEESGAALPASNVTPAAKARPCGHQRETPVVTMPRCYVVAVKGCHDTEWTACEGVSPSVVAKLLARSPTVSEGEGSFPLTVLVSNGHVLGCDVIISATGVTPCVGFMPAEFARHSDGGIVVNDKLQAPGFPDVYVAGDACHVESTESSDWFQMRLWTQARTMGLYAAQSMANTLDDLNSGFAFELFAHATRLFGFKVVLLGLFNGQGLGEEYEQRIRHLVATTTTASREGSGTVSAVSAGSSVDADVQVQVRVTPGVEYIKIVLHKGRVRGAMLIGDTDLEETFENLILNQLNVGALGLDLLDPAVDLEDYFD